MMAVVFLSEAEREMIEAASNYQKHGSILAVEFLTEIERAVLSIAETPHTWPAFEGEFRRRLIRRFPFGIIYRIGDDEIVVVAVMHLRRKPGYWNERK